MTSRIENPAPSPWWSPRFHADRRPLLRARARTFASWRKWFDERGFLAKLDGIEGYLVSDIERFPDVPYWVVRSDTVRRWWREGKLGAGSKVSYDEARRLLAEMPLQAVPKP